MNTTIRRNPPYQQPTFTASHALSLKGELAVKLTEHFGTVAGTPDGEDSAGRAKLALQTPETVVERAIAIADLLVDRMAEKGWLLSTDIPEPESEPAKTH